MRIFCCAMFIFILFTTNSDGQIWIDDFDGSNTAPVVPLALATECGGDPNLYHFGVVCENGGGCSREMHVAFTGQYGGLVGNFLGAVQYG